MYYLAYRLIYFLNLVESVILAQAEIQWLLTARKLKSWIPAFARMTLATIASRFMPPQPPSESHRGELAG